MDLKQSLSSVALGQDQTMQEFAVAGMRAAKGAKKSLTQAPTKCASGSCEKRIKYQTKEEAAKAALDAINKKSIGENKEYAGQIYKNADGTHGYTDPVAGVGDESHPSDSPIPSDSQLVGNYHTHGDYSVMTPDGLVRASSLPGAVDNQSDQFSQGDFDQYTQQGQRYPGFTGYLGTPSGAMRSFDTKTGLDLYVSPLK